VLQGQYRDHHESGRGGGSIKYHTSRARTVAWRVLIRLHVFEKVLAWLEAYTET